MEEHEECECCGHYTVPTKNYRRRGKDQNAPEDIWLCLLCASTYASTAYQYFYETHPILAAICYVGNEILTRLPPAPQEREEHDG